MDFKRIMIGLDFTHMDQTVLDYATFMCELIRPDDVYFVHIEPSLEVGDNFLKEYNIEDLSPDEKIEEKMKDIVALNFNYTAAEHHFEVHEGNIDEKMVHWIKVKDIDVVFMGRKKSMGDSGLIPTRIARRSGASVFLVPEDFKPKLDKVVVGTDFSDYSKDSVNVALDLKAAAGGKTEVYCEHVYFVPSGFYKTGKSYEEFADIMKDNARKDFQRFSRELKGDVIANYTLDEDRQPADKVYQFANQKGADLIIVGGKGRTFSSAVMLGSVAERLTNYDVNIPLLILKKKNEEWGFWEALKSL